jgi:fatty-acyl-CoA synthase
MPNEPIERDDCVLYGPSGVHLPSEPGAPQTLIEALLRLRAEHRENITFYDHELQPSVLSYAEMIEQVARRGAALKQLCPRRGERIALVISDCREFTLTFFGAVWVGLVPVPLALPTMQRQRGYLETIASVVAAAHARVLVASRALSELFSPLQSDRGLQLCEVESLGPSDVMAPADSPRPDELCFLQFTSGSTSTPKGVRVTHRSLIENVAAIAVRLELQSGRDGFLSWLPLHHDMGLIGFLLVPVVNRVRAVLYPTSAFVWRPSTWMQLVDRHRSTVSFAPNFAYGLAARRQKNIESLDLSCMRVFGCGAEPIQPATLHTFIDTFRVAKLSPTVVMPAYGMAEHTLAISFDSFHEPLRTLTIDRDVYEHEGRVRVRNRDEDARTLELVSCGKPFDRHAIAILGPDGSLLPPGQVGEIGLRGPSATAGYFEDRAASESLFLSGWLRTGDLGFVHDGNLYVSGRLKDVMIVNGRNVYPHDLEWMLEEIRGLRPGRIAAFSVSHGDSEAAVIVVEPLGSGSHALRAAIQTRATEILGAAPYEIVFAAPNQIPQTSSGKVQRAKTRALYLAGTLRRTSLTATPAHGATVRAELPQSDLS